MKHLFFHSLILLSALFIIPSCNKDDYYNDDRSPLTREQAITLVQDIVDMYDCAAITEDPVPARTLLVRTPMFGRKSLYSPNFKAWLCIINMDVRANGGDFLLYVFVNVNTGELTQFKFCDFPDDGVVSTISIKEVIPPQFEPESNILKSLPDLNVPNEISASSPSSGQWAVIISGGYNKRKNWFRYWNDCAEIYKTLINTYHYPKAHIFVLMSDGTSAGVDRNLGYNDYGPFDSSPTDLDGDGYADITHSATVSNINTVFTYLGQNVSAGDNVLIYVIDHGEYSNNQSHICLWNNSSISSSSFASQVNKITSYAHKHIVLGQCYSGGFIPVLSGSNRTITAACSASQPSYATSNFQYDEFVYHWTNAVRGTTPIGTTVNADLDGFAGISAYEAFTYAQTNDAQYETPQFYASYDAFGKQYGLDGQHFSSPTISGPSETQNHSSVAITVANLLSGASTQWSYDSGFYSPSTSGNTLYLQTAIIAPFAYKTIYASISNSYVSFDKSHTVLIWNSGHFQDNGYINGQGTSFALSCPDGAYGFIWGCQNSEWEPEIQGHPFVDFQTNSADPAPLGNIWVAFRNPYNEQIIIEKDLS